ncbi:MAG TPA: hypothetical protein VGK59_15595 [Ohtaekwangia sp.]
MITRKKEVKNQRIAFLTSIGIHSLILVVLLFLVAWQAPDPPLGALGYGGVEVNLGFDEQGYGDIQPENLVGSEGTQQEEPEKTNEEPQPQEPETKPEQEIVSEEESAVAVKAKKEDDKPVEKPKEKPVEVKKEPEKKVDQNATYKPNTQKTESDNKTTDGKAGKSGNHGDDKGTTGDKGNPEGSLDAKALYGKPGSGGGDGGGVSMSGFNGFEWPKVVTPELPSNAFGVYEFTVKIDEQGEVISVTPLQRGLSLEAEKKLKDMIQRLSFIAKGSNLPPQTEGKIIFRVVSN